MHVVALSSFRIFMWTDHFRIWSVLKLSWNKMMLDLVTSQVTVRYSLQLLQALVHCRVFFSFFSRTCMCMIVYPEMSVDSDRDSVIESEDGKETVVRQFSFSFTAIFKVFFFKFCRLHRNKKTPNFYKCIHLTAFRWELWSGGGRRSQ